MSQSKAELVAPVGIFTASGVNVTGVVTAASFQGDGSQLQGVGIGTTGSVNSSGIITASAFYGSGIGLTGITLLGPTNSYETTGIITASAFYGDGAGITNINGPLSPITYNPGIGATNVGITTNITITFGKPIIAAGATTGVGTITLRTGSADGTIVESFDIVDSSQLSISGGVLTIDPTSNLSGLTTYFVVIPEGTLKDTIDSSDNVGITTYSFTSQPLNRELYAWGTNDRGQLGINETTSLSSPRQVPGTQWNDIFCTYRHSFATKTDGTAWAWGYNQYGALGQNQNTPFDYSSPTQIPGTQWSYASGGQASLSGLKTDGTLWAWGYNGFGQAGQNDIINYSSPVQVPGTDWKIVFDNAYVGYMTMAAKTDGTLWIWGSNSYGNLGLNEIETIHHSSPVQMPGTQWNTTDKNTACVAGYGAAVLKTDGTLWTWGIGNFGQMAESDRINRSSPIQVPGTQWSKVSHGHRTVAATKTDGTLWVWGRNGEGPLGQNNRTYYSSPVQIPGTQWDIPFAGYNNTGGTKTDGTLWMCGQGPKGFNAQNNVTYYSSPVQIPGTQWVRMEGAVYSALAIKQTT